MLLASLAAHSVQWKGRGAETAFDLPKEASTQYTVQQTAASAPSNVFWPGDQVRFTLQLTNNTDQPIAVTGTAEVIQYAITSDPLDIWTQIYQKVADCGAVPVKVTLPAKGFTDLEITPVQPKRFGAYVLVLDLPGQGRAFAAAYVYVPKPTPGRVQHPAFAMDIRGATDAACAMFQRLGIKGTRIEYGYTNTTDPGFKYRAIDMAHMFNRMWQHDITTIVTLGGGHTREMPLGRIRNWLNDKDEGTLQYPGDFTWLPKYDPDFQELTFFMSSQFGWPKGPINAVELWNEPWEGISISGWGADLPRYREIYTAMAQGVEAARRQHGVQVLLGGACSSMNTEDKLFPDGKDTFLKWLDFTSIHYQPMGNVPALIPEWINRKHPNGPVQPWDTESWMANSEERVAPVIASMRATGLTRTAGVYHDNVRTIQDITLRTPGGSDRRAIIQVWSVGAGIAGMQHCIGERKFNRLLFTNGLPWLFVFDGLPAADGTPRADDGTVVVVGDLSGVYQREQTKFYSVLGLANLPKIADVKRRITALPATASAEERRQLNAQLRTAQVLTGATMTLAGRNGLVQLFDVYGNRIPEQRGNIIIPLNGMGYYLRTNGTPGSFAKLLAALQTARIDGYEPLDMQASDMTNVLQTQPTVTLTLTNILNRPVTGTLSATLGALTLETPTQTLAFAPHETKTLDLKVIGGTPTDTNTYPLVLTFNARKDGTATLEDTLRVNLIAKRTITVDGDLNDWKGVLPHVVQSSGDSGPNLTEQAWLPFVKFPEKVGAGLSIGYLAYDAQYFYFAAKVSDTTPNGGHLRFATRDDDQYYYPEKVYQIDKTGKRIAEHTWPEGVRRFTYRKNPDLPFGGDGIQLAFNVLPPAEKGMIPFAPGTMEKFQVYKDTDYEYYLHKVGERWGGGTEIWRLLAPGVPRKHFYPRQPKAPKDGGPVENGKLRVVEDATTRIVECALPWTEIPDVKAALDAGKTLKFTFRVTDDKGPNYELAAGRSVSKMNPLTFHAYWVTHWANEVEFGFER